MANPEHVEIVKQGAEAIARWREENPDTRLDLTGTDFSNASLRELDLNWANLSWAILRGADLRGANLRGANLRGSNLHGADFSAGDLREADISRTDLNEANLRQANLCSANFAEAKLNEANLSEAKLSAANFSKADLSLANLNWADLSGADFSGADLNDADFCGATLGSTTLVNVDLRTVPGIDKLLHLGPSGVSTSTLALSQGKIPDVFLRGCGLSDWEIAAARLYALGLTSEKVTQIGYEIINIRNGQPIQFYSTFISYSHADKAFAHKLHDALQARGIRCWLDEHQLLPGDDIYEQVDRGVRLWDKVLLCASQSSLTSWWVDNELDTAFEKEQRLMKERDRKVLALVPIDLDGYMFSDQWQSGKAKPVQSRIAAKVKGWEADNTIFAREFERIVKALQLDDGGREPPPEPRL